MKAPKGSAEASEPTAKQIETIVPKFSANWIQNVRFDRIVINLSDCEYEVLHKVAKALKFKIKKEPDCAEWDVWWTDWAVAPQVLMKMEHHQKINHFPGMHVLSRKNLLAKNLMKMRKKSPHQYNFFPLTWNLPSDFHEFKAYFDTKPKGKARTYIVKPESMSQGKGIFLTRRLEEINPTQHCVVQRYLSRPYLIDGLKFDLRIYVLVAGVDPLRLYIYNQGLARFATEPYIGPQKDNMDDICMHLTNYAINKDSDKFVFNEDVNDMGVGHKRSLQSVLKNLKDKGENTDVLIERIHQLIVKTLISGLSHLRFQYRSCQGENYRSDMCFELLGFDVILTDGCQPYLLEINYTPSFSTDTPLDLHIKKGLISNALVLMEVTTEFKEKTVRQRKECRDNRMITGKKPRLTPEEKELKKREAQQARDTYIKDHLGGFTQIYPLDKNHEMTPVYEMLIETEAQPDNGSRKVIRKDDEQPPPVPQPRLSKLPVLSRRDEQPKLPPQRKPTFEKPSSSSIKNREKSCIEYRSKAKYHESSEKLIAKDVKRKAASRQTLIPRPINIQAGTLSEGIGILEYRAQLNRLGE